MVDISLRREPTARPADGLVETPFFKRAGKKSRPKAASQFKANDCALGGHQA
jgi:hypothetical protein